MEEMLISAIMPIMSIYRLPHGQYGYSGHVINLPQDVSSFATSLPRLSSELDVIVVRKEGANQSHRDFRVRRSVIYQALHWLVTNNIYYRANQITINHDTLAQLPQDGNLSNVSTVTMPCPSLSEEGIRPEQGDESIDDHLTQSFVPTATRSMTEQEAARQSVQQRQSGQNLSNSSPVMWPSIGGSLPPRATSPAHFLLSSQQVQVTSLAKDRIRSPLETTSNISSCTTTVASRSILDSASSLSTRRCDGVRSRQAECT